MIKFFNVNLNKNSCETNLAGIKRNDNIKLLFIISALTILSTYLELASI